MNVKQWLRTAKHPDADLIMLGVLSRHVLNRDKTYLVSHEQDELSSAEFEQANAWLKRRKNGEPLAYILGYKEFYGHDFVVTPDVLIPRPETEMIIDLVKELNPKEIVEIGTGSGCIAISLALELPETHIEAVDISEAALKVAETNRRAFGLNPDRLELHKSNLLADISTPVADVVVANLPYVDRDWDWLDRNVLDFEPSLALYADDAGLALVNKLIVQFAETQIAKHLVLEADPSQHQKIINFAKKQGLKYLEERDFVLHFVN